MSHELNSNILISHHVLHCPHNLIKWVCINFRLISSLYLYLISLWKFHVTLGNRKCSHQLYVCSPRPSYICGTSQGLSKCFPFQTSPFQKVVIKNGLLPIKHPDGLHRGHSWKGGHYSRAAVSHR